MAIFFRSPEQFIGTVKGQNNVWKKNNMVMEVSTNGLKQFNCQVVQIIWMYKSEGKS